MFLMNNSLALQRERLIPWTPAARTKKFSDWLKLPTCWNPAAKIVHSDTWRITVSSLVRPLAEECFERTNIRFVLFTILNACHHQPAPQPGSRLRYTSKKIVFIFSRLLITLTRALHFNARLVFVCYMQNCNGCLIRTRKKSLWVEMVRNYLDWDELAN